ncbi:hypothetical protein BIFCAT_01977 [Bifidobacterium catenulatum DSM 16992 = JCM 1194 = LMG 11043]|uniref:Uncharacterized protein n=1 Tax=Bifidobacterium catenulatum DSM 16992 = JCM 1194 = LMG 11043 TaxID=566552 RepID=B6XXL7_9BIFI|nr:hypothetical protein BIFCAT_01977 [Bifidobacterium catenulatum DSM 16992 = JCM 1194 = LMG 11043]
MFNLTKSAEQACSPIRMLVCAEYAFGDCCVWQNDVHYWYGCSNE